jgi:hypothetical protein
MMESFLVSRVVMTADPIQDALGCGFFALEHLHRLAGHDRRDRMLVNQLRMTVTAQKDAEIVKGRNNAREFYTIYQKNRQ